GRPGAVTIATNMAGRGTDIQLGGNLDMRLHDEIPEDATSEQRATLTEKIKAEVAANRQIVLDAGGLYIIGTERHESRRIDNQLRGRSGRQGDPGASMFFLSAQDDLMRIFSPDALEAVLSNRSLGLKDGEALTHPWLSKALERAQTRVEQQNYEIRKNLLKFDNVMNDQRKVIYEQRHEIMEAETVTEMVDDMRHDIAQDLVAAAIPAHAYAEQWDVATLKTEVQNLLALDLPIADWAKEEGIADEEILERISKASDEKMAEKRKRAGDNFFNHVEKSFVLRLLDQHWKEHLLHLDHLRQGINLRAFAQRDPLNEYKSEAFGMFEAMMGRLKTSIVQQLSLVEINIDEQTYQRMIEEQRAKEEELAKESRTDPALQSGTPQGADNTVQFRRPFNAEEPSTWQDNVPRNAPCPCGSGKKFKYCHGKID
ncbi:MAG TPA: SEC-C metal-binding domain-containing protein, partial [Alphaproteobacteria bacterium]|nr:SEC-C metal-binding domain-containing protein [Alphaproteobacteria bacterium]